MSTIRFPAEWEAQDAIQMTWPSQTSDWRDDYREVEECLIKTVGIIAATQKVIVITEHLTDTIPKLTNSPSENLRVIQVKTNDTWARDYGAIGIYDSDQPKLIDFTFDGWGGKFESALDNQLTAHLAARHTYAAPVQRVPLVLEGGSLETDGQGTLLATRSSILHPSRNPQYSQPDIENIIADQLGITRFLWLDHGHIIGDDTDGHIDTLARFANAQTILYTQCEDQNDPHFVSLKEMEQQLATFRTVTGDPYHLVPLPLPTPCFHPLDQHRLPATYANFLITNQAILVPTYDTSEDLTAIGQMIATFPGRKIIPVDCRVLIRQHGSLHCMTMQYTRGTIQI